MIHVVLIKQTITKLYSVFVGLSTDLIFCYIGGIGAGGGPIGLEPNAGGGVPNAGGGVPAVVFGAPKLFDGAPNPVGVEPNAVDPPGYPVVGVVDAFANPP